MKKKEYPLIIQEIALKRFKEQGQYRKGQLLNLSDIQELTIDDFTWSDTEEGHNIWSEVHNHNNYELLFNVHNIQCYTTYYLITLIDKLCL